MTTTSTPTVAAVSVTYNRCEPLLILLRQLRELDFDPARLHVFLVDNASSDDTVQRVRAEFPEVRLFENDQNTGVSAGFNRSVQEALAAGPDYKYLWLLDSDVEIEPGTLTTMVKAMEEDDRIGVVGSAVYDPVQRTRLVTAGLRVDWRRADIPYVFPDGRTLLDVDLVPACSMLVRTSVYKQVGMWDMRFPLYWGDTDWCARVIRSGYRSCCDVLSRVWHRDWSMVTRGFGGAGFIRDHVRGGLLFYLRHDPNGSTAGVRRLMLKTCVKAALERLTMRHGYSRAYLGAVHDVLAGNFDRNFAAPSSEPKPIDLDGIGRQLAPLLPPRPRIVLNQLPDTARKALIKESLARHFEEIDWIEIESTQKVGAEWSEYRAFKPAQLISHARRMLTGFGRPDVNVCSISTPFLYNFAAARYAVLLDDSNHGVIERSLALGGMADAARMVVRGLKAAYLDLPRALKSCRPLREAVAANDFADPARNPS